MPVLFLKSTLCFSTIFSVKSLELLVCWHLFDTRYFNKFFLSNEFGGIKSCVLLSTSCLLMFGANWRRTFPSLAVTALVLAVGKADLKARASWYRRAGPSIAPQLKTVSKTISVDAPNCAGKAGSSSSPLGIRKRKGERGWWAFLQLLFWPLSAPENDPNADDYFLPFYPCCQALPGSKLVTLISFQHAR